MHYLEVVLVAFSPNPLVVSGSRFYAPGGALPTVMLECNETCTGALNRLIAKLPFAQNTCVKLDQVPLFDATDRVDGWGQRFIGVPFVAVVLGCEGDGWHTFDQLAGLGLSDDHLAIVAEAVNYSWRH